ncbi:hypothetical protein B0T16DRAFT_407568 [Cercophora newfieldiana]|uniref:Uncharacterized protein n=1 Tax=Cercophora newfieldiana TaxID=92897 RepID=A0AA39Y8I0_9PEZI|nr:hypothetical protein B0T16DRAFT_407568 [Cercophora newfieldiana]
MFPWLARRYRKVGAHDIDTRQSFETAPELDHDPKCNTKPTSRFDMRQIGARPTITGLATAIVVIGFVILLVVLAWDHSHDTNEVEIHNCGNSSHEALALGCSFDQLTWSWYPPKCPHYANDEYLAAEEWAFYLDNQGQDAVSSTDPRWINVLDNKIELWGQQREHTAHCVFVFLSLAQILETGRQYASYYRRYEHMVHCSRVLLDALKMEPDRERIATFVGKVSYSQHCT